MSNLSINKVSVYFQLCKDYLDSPLPPISATLPKQADANIGFRCAGETSGIINADCFLPQLKVGFHRKQELVDKYLLESSDIVLLIEHQHGLLVIY